MKLGIAVLFVSGLVLTACDLQPVEEHQIARLPAPGGAVTAVVKSRNCGATCSMAYAVYLGSEKPGDEIFLVDKSDPPRLRWQDKEHLIISVPCGRIFKFTNFADIPTRQDQYDTIQIRLENDRVACS